MGHAPAQRPRAQDAPAHVQRADRDRRQGVQILLAIPAQAVPCAGLRLVALRDQAGLSQEDLADRCGFARSYMSRMERGGANLSLDAIERLATGLKVPVVKLFEE